MSVTLSGSKKREPHGKFPSVSINDQKVIVEAYQQSVVSKKIYYKVGQLKGQKMDMCEGDNFLDYGRYPKVAVNNENLVVEVHRGKYVNNVYYRIGMVNLATRRINWNTNVQKLCRGQYPAVAVHGNIVVITHDYPYVACTTYYHIGTVNRERNAIDWAVTRERLFESVYVSETSVAVNDRCMVVTGRGGVGEILCRVGNLMLQDNKFKIETWKDISFEHRGYFATVGLKDDGHILMVWQSFTLRRLIYITGKIDGPRDIEWSSSESHMYGVGYNPTVSVSPRDGLVLEEHETNYSGGGRCTLYYHCGTLVEEEADREQENRDPNRENLNPAAGLHARENLNPHQDQIPNQNPGHLDPHLPNRGLDPIYLQPDLARHPQPPQNIPQALNHQAANLDQLAGQNIMELHERR